MQQFEHLTFHRDRFEPALLAELLHGGRRTPSSSRATR